MALMGVIVYTCSILISSVGLVLRYFCRRGSASDVYQVALFLAGLVLLHKGTLLECD
jgi:hypothetical protein